jgi:hypothetical protein
MEPIEVRLARLEEGMVSVKGDTSYLRKGFDAFKQAYWEQLVKMTGRVAGVAALTSFIVGVVTVALAHALWK